MSALSIDLRLRGLRLQECCSTVLLQAICTWSRVEVVGCIVENYNTFYGELYNLLAFLVACVTTNCRHLMQTREGEYSNTELSSVKYI